MNNKKQTPMMQQFYQIKAKYPDFILFFRLGDFYEMFDKDAEETSRILDIALTKRQNQKMCGIPYHAKDNYLYKMIKAGKKVAICEQVEEPSKNKIVKRAVVELITPGTFTDEKHLQSSKDSFLLSVHVSNEEMALTACDASTGKFLVFKEERNVEKFSSLLKQLSASEIIYSSLPEDFKKAVSLYYSNSIAPYYFEASLNETLLLEHFKIKNLKGLSLDSNILKSSCGAALRYLKENLFQDIKHLNKLQFLHSKNYLFLPESTLTNLEILEPLFSSGEDSSLFNCLNETKTAMGARQLRNWLIYPLQDKTLIEKRLDKVEFFVKNNRLLKQIREELALIPDLERLLSKISLLKSNPKAVVSFNEGLKVLEKIKALKELSIFEEIKNLDSLKTLTNEISHILAEDPPVTFDDGGVIKTGIDFELDELKELTQHGKEMLLKIEAREKEQTGIQKLKLRFNKVIGYYLEVSKSNLDKVPAHYMRKQSLVNAERFTIDELVQYESKILNARSQMIEKEKEIFNSLLEKIIQNINSISENISFIKEIDLFCCFAQVAFERTYTKPILNDTQEINIVNGRHPVVEQFAGEYHPNSVKLDSDKNRLLLITGPNMAGKSTFLRQTAIITLMAHVGCFVPAQKAEIALTDQIFTRVGASDNLAAGESTFLVEMSETSQILRNCSSKSLIIMDEVGRGTSTYDGLSLAWAIVEYLVDPEIVKGKTLFATHYHELTVLESEKGIKNLRMAVREYEDEIIFLHKVEEGAADKSYGIHVAQIAGIPSSVIKRAQNILASMEIQLLSNEQKLLKSPLNQSQAESLFESKEEPFEFLKNRILAQDINHTTPTQALILLEQLQNEIKKKSK